MSPTTPPLLATPPRSRRARDRGAWFDRVCVPLGFTIVALLAYGGTLHAPFVFDDGASILENPSIRDLSRWSDVLRPPTDATGAVGRPLVNLSLALNYALGGTAPFGYHLANLGLHVATALALFGGLRRLLLLSGMGAARTCHASGMAAVVVLLWLAHPLQSESVVCTIQRSEVLVGLWYALTIYAFLRSVETESRSWAAVSVLACAAGMASKELMVSAPLLVWAIDRTLIAGTWGGALRRRPVYYGALASTWLIVAALVFGSAQRGGTAGFGLGMSSVDYLFTQSRALLLYLKLALWPHPLVLDYGAAKFTRLTEVWAPGLLLLALFAGTLHALWRRSVCGIVGLWFFAILAPSSSFIPLTTQTIAEHRMYLPLLSVVVGAIAAIQILGARRAALAATGVSLALLALTARRGRDYRDEQLLWQDTLAKYPSNARAHNNLGALLYARGDTAGAIDCFRRAVALMPDYADAHKNLGAACLTQGQVEEAVAAARRAVEFKPDASPGYYTLGNALLAARRPGEAIGAFEAALRYAKPNSAQLHLYHHNLATALEQTGQLADAIRHYGEAIAARPDYADSHNNLGLAFGKRGEAAVALQHLDRAIALKPTSADLHYNRAFTLVGLARYEEAVAAYRETLRLRPQFAVAQWSLGALLLHLGRNEEALDLLERTVAQHPDVIEAVALLGDALLRAGRAADAVAQYQKALERQPDNLEARANLGLALHRSGRPRDAVPHFLAVLARNPNAAAVHYNCALALKDIGETERARAHYERARALRPDLPELTF